MATLTFHGATRGVTGSLYHIRTRHSSLLLECGLIQGSHDEEAHNQEPFPIDPAELDAVIVSHAHLDHSGRLPRLVQQGYGGAIHVTRATAELLEIMLKDAAYLAGRDAEWENRRRQRSGREEIQPLFTFEDAEAAVQRCRRVDYGERIKVCADVELRFLDAGHILGSSIVELYIREDGQERKLVFSGDLGNSCAALLRDPHKVRQADVLLLESTYGDRNHRPMQDTLDEFEGILRTAQEKGGNVLIPSFAVGRTQEVIFRLGEMYRKGLLRDQLVFLDSPMAIAATEVYHRYQDVFNREDKAALRSSDSGSLHSFLPNLRYTRTAEESRALNRIQSGAVIIAGSGMCNGGRIRHHLKHNLWRANTHVIFVGFQARGTPGRALVEGTDRVRMGGEDIAVKAQIHTLGGFSAHASQQQLLDWVEGFERPPSIYLVHGEEDAKTALQAKMEDRGWRAQIAEPATTIDI